MNQPTISLRIKKHKKNLPPDPAPARGPAARRAAAAGLGRLPPRLRQGERRGRGRGEQGGEWIYCF